MTRINFNRYSNPGFGSPNRPGSPSTSAPDAPEPSLLTRIADHCAMLGSCAYPLTEAVQVDGVRVLRSGGMNEWAARLGWREGEHMRLFERERRAAAR